MNDVIETVHARPNRVTGAARHLVPMDDDKQAIFDEVGDLSAFKLPLNRLLLAIYKPPERTKGGIIRPDIVRNEDVYQGVVGLVVKMGPHAYENSANMDFLWDEGDVAHVGDWVMFRRAQGLRVDVNGRECLIMEDERGIKMVLPRPDAVL